MPKGTKKGLTRVGGKTPTTRVIWRDTSKGLILGTSSADGITNKKVMEQYKEFLKVIPGVRKIEAGDDHYDD
jgi:hypothetical protein